MIMRNNIQIIKYKLWVASRITNDVRRNSFYDNGHHLLHLSIQIQNEYRWCCIPHGYTTDLTVHNAHTCSTRFKHCWLPNLIHAENFADILLAANSGCITAVMKVKNFYAAQVVPSHSLL